MTSPPSFIERVLDQSTLRKTQVACTDDSKSWSHDEFIRHAFGVAQALSNIPFSRIGIVAEHVLETYASIMGVWLSGKTYVPIDVDEQQEHILEELQQLNIEFVLTNAIINFFPDSIEQIHTTSLRQTAIRKKQPIDPEQCAYILSTSGTTGQPKHIPISYGNLSCFVDSFLSLDCDLQATDRFLQSADLKFDMSIISFLIPLSVGASFHVFKDKTNRALKALSLIPEKQISICVLPPSSAMLMLPYLSEVASRTLRCTFFGAELLTPEVASKWQAWALSSSVYNLYGPSEGGIFSTAQQYDSDLHGEFESVPIGHPVKHIQTRLERLTDSGSEGELWISGPQVFKGYLDTNAQPFATVDGVTWYKTGDVVSENEMGELVFVGRLDRQEKVMGQRIDLGAMEKALNNLGVSGLFCCVATTNKQGLKRAIAIIEDSAHNQNLRNKINSLPSTLRPSIIHYQKQLPVTPEGEVDRMVLQTSYETLHS